MNSAKVMVLVTVVMSVLMSAIDTTIVILALPTITGSLHTSLKLSIWIILVYLLCIAVFTTQMGSVSDNYGRKKLYIIGIGVFTLGSGLSGYSPTIIHLIAFRIIQGIGAAMIQGNSNAIIADNFELKERGRAFGFTTLGWNIGGTLGIVLGGVITSFMGWSYIFYINVPIGIMAMIFGLKYIIESKPNPRKVDYSGIVFLALALSLISYGAIEVASTGVSTYDLLFIVVGLLFLVPFIYHESRVENGVINLKAFRIRGLSFSLIASFLQAVGYLSIVFILIMYLQGIRGYSPLNASLLLVPGYVLASLLSPKMGALSDRFGQRSFATLGIVLMTFGVGIYMTLGLNTSVYVVIAGSLVSGIGGSMFWPANNSSVMRHSPKNLYGSMSGLLRTLANIGTLMSFVLTISVASSAIPRYVAFEVFVGTQHIVGGLSQGLLSGLRASFIFSACVLVVAAVFSYFRATREDAVAKADGTS